MQGIAPQNRHIKSVTQDFLNVHWDQKKPLLLGYSGGPDSKALLYSLLECGVTPHLAHVDHGWRKESKEQATALFEEAKSLGCPFHTISLHIEKKEDVARKERIAYFQTLAKDYSALLLAHQADDLAETVLKRILEGAHLEYISGMQPVSYQYGMHIWRPFLFIRKFELLQYLEEKGISYITDPSNFDPAYLRTRMRQEIFPCLKQNFGKEFISNLTLLSQRSTELKEYLDQKIAHIPIHESPWGIFVEMDALARLEQRHLLQTIARRKSISLSKEVLDSLLNWLENPIKPRELILKKWKIYVDKAKVFFFLFP